jgi:excinuclease ABC subunit A
MIPDTKMKKDTDNFIRITGAKQNNLKGLNIDLPLNQMIVITGVSGSGKSSLAFDTIYAEGQRRYVETFSSYARQFLDRMDRPKVDKIEGMLPAIAIDQTNPVRTSRSTVGTMTELNDHIKLLFARASFLVCRECGKRITKDSPESIYSQIAEKENNQEVLVTFKIAVPDNFGKDEVKQLLQSQGYTRIYSEDAKEIEVIQDRTVIIEDNRSRIIEDLEAALHLGKGAVTLYTGTDQKKTIYRFSEGLHCPDCDIYYKEPLPGTFSFNSPIGACDTCRGFGRVIGVDYNLVIPDSTISLAQGAVKPWQTPSYHESQEDMMRFAKKKGIAVNTPWSKLPEQQKQWVLQGEGSWEDGKWYGVKRFFEWMETKSYKMHIRVLLSKYRGYYVCKTCNGSRLKPDALLWRIGDGDGITIQECMQMSISNVSAFFNALVLPAPFDEAAEMVMSEIRTRLRYLEEVGLGYLTLDRQSRTLSGGEVQRINLTTALGTSLVNTMFVLDEPSIGLHSRDIRRLIGVLHKLRDAGNSLIIVEHDPELIRAADYVVDMGPGPGERGGEIVYYGKTGEMFNAATSITAQYLTGEKTVYARKKIPNKKKNAELKILGAAEHNLKEIDVAIPLNQLVCITGVSGSGKSTLIQEVCFNGLRQKLGRPVEEPGKFREMVGIENISDVILVDQAPVGKTTRSNPASYVGAFDAIRKLFANQPVAVQRGYTAGTFSFNSGTGRCPVCSGNGFEHVEMQFLSDIYLRCPDCNGKRFRSEILEITVESKKMVQYGAKSISDVLEMTVEDACDFFAEHAAVVRLLNPLRQVGLSYMKIGQPLPTLSGGEAQRLKLAGYLAETSSSQSKNILFLFDEPTTGLHFADISILMDAFYVLIDKGHSVVVIEHNLDVINGADWVIDMGPEGGDGGGEILFCGTPSDLAKCKKSHTGIAIKQYSLNFGKPYVSGDPEKKERIPVSTNICIRQAKEHNLQNIDITIPRDAFTVITGVSGSGKSTIAFDILFAEGQRRYLESLNAYARQFVQPASKPDVDSVSGVPPTVAIEQRTSRGGRKSTVATVTEIYHFLRLLFVKLATQHCPDCNIPIEPQSKEAVAAEIMKVYKGKELSFFAPLVINRKGIYNDLAKWAAAKGFSHLRVDTVLLPTDKWPKIDRFKEHSLELPVGKLIVQASDEKALREMVDLTFEYGKGTIYVEVKGKNKSEPRIFSTSRSCPRCQRSFDELDPRLFSYNSKHGWCPDCFGTGLEIQGFDENQTGEEIWWNEWFDGSAKVCKTCHGHRLRREALAVKLAGKSISEYCAISVLKVSEVFDNLKWNQRDSVIAVDIISELKSRLQFLSYVGLDYLTLDRAAPTLSGGEAQRIRLASQLGSNLKGVCYILDEPTIGLHPRDNEKLLDTLILLKEKGNTVVVVEHDEDTIRRADYIIDLGPGGGKNGGKITADGTLQQIMKNKNSTTGKYLKNPLAHNKAKRDTDSVEWLTIKKATLHNLKAVDIIIPMGRFVCVTGVSGSGKSTLVRDVLFDNIKNLLSKETEKVFGCEKITGWNGISRILEVDQRPIGKTPRSCPSTYVGFWDDIRKLFAKTAEALIRGYDASRFSFNVAKGRCDACEGQGIKKIEMSFMPDVSVVCEVCGGKRFTQDTLDIEFKGKTIADVLNMSVDEGVDFFAAHPKIHGALVLLQDVGLGYLTLGQQSPTLSGGEAQRIKLVTELDKTNQSVASRKIRAASQKNKALYILDEPTVGLHMADIDRLIRVLHKLVDSGNSVVIIEHNLDVVAEADWVIDLGPEGGTGGGKIIAQGTPEKIVSVKESYTGSYLKTYVEREERVSSIAGRGTVKP